MVPAEHNSLENKLHGGSVVQWARNPVSTAVGGEVVLMNLDRGRCYGLGPTGTDLWNKLAQPIRVADVVRQLSEEYTAEPGVLERDVLDTLEQYAQEGLIAIQPSV